MDNDRLKHNYAVANKMIELGKEKSLSEIELQELFLLGYLHDIGYEFGTNENHNSIDTSADADQLNASSHKPSTLTFVVKS